MFGSRWVITPLWLSGSWRSLLCSSLCTLATSSKYILLLLGSYRFCPLLCPFCMKCSLGISNFFEEISSLSHSIASLYFFALITEEVFLISPCYYLEQMGISFLFVLAFTSLLFTVVCKASSHNHFAFLHFLFLGMVLITASCIVSWTSFHSSSGTLSIRSNPLNLICHFDCIIIRDLI